MRYKNIFILETENKNNAILVRKKGQPIYLLSSNLQVQLLYCRIGYASNTRVIKILKFVDRINFRKVLEVADEPYFSNSKTNNNFDKDGNNRPLPINKIIDNNIEDIKTFVRLALKVNIQEL